MKEPEQTFVVNEPTSMCCGRPSRDCRCGERATDTVEQAEDDFLPLPESTLSVEKEERQENRRARDDGEDSNYPMLDD